MQKILIIGASGQAKIVVNIVLQQAEFELIGFIDDGIPAGKQVLGYPVLGGMDQLKELVGQYDCDAGVVAVGDNAVRRQLVNKIIQSCSQFKFINCIHPSANVAIDVEMGEGNVLMAGANLNTSTKLGSHCIINTQASVDHDSRIDNFTSIAPGVVTGGNVVIGEFAAIGIGAIILHGISVAKNCIVGAGSLVNKNTEENAIYYGSPATYQRAHILGDKYL